MYCYNTVFSSCSTSSAPGATVSYPISKLIVFRELAGMSNWAATETHYDGYGNVTYSAQYDFGGSSPTRATTITYYQAGTSCGALSTGSHIQDKPCEVQTTQGGSVVADAKYTYDTHGNLLTTSLWNGSAWIAQTTANSYNSNGTPSKTYDLANNETDYSYGGSNYLHCSSCSQYPFPTKVLNVGTGDYISTEWYGDGGVKYTDTDSNGNTVTYGYTSSGGTADPYWRVSSITDPYSSVTYYTYPTGSSPTTSGHSFTFNSGNSIQNTTMTTDAYGRPTDVQTQQAPSSTMYDTVSTAYGWSGNYRTVASSQPCPTTSGGGCPIVHTDYYDPVERLYQRTTTSNETLTNTYTQNDVLSVLSPPPSGENWIMSAS